MTTCGLRNSFLHLHLSLYTYDECHLQPLKRVPLLHRSGFRVKLFLEQFGVSAGVLNCELPLASRWHCIQAPPHA